MFVLIAMIISMASFYWKTNLAYEFILTDNSY